MDATLFAKSFPAHYRDADLKRLFARWGPVLSAQVKFDRATGASRRLGFVRLASKANAEQAIQALDGHDFDDAVLRVCIASAVSGGRDESGDAAKRRMLFPRLSEQQRQALQLDETALFSVSPQDEADMVSQWIRALVPTAQTITDATACAGGNTMSFAAHFPSTIAVEQDAGRFAALCHNLQVCGLRDKVRILHADYGSILASLRQDVVFIDPPWGGKGYKSQERLRLDLAGRPLSDVCRSLLLNRAAALIVLKVPLNFDFDDMALQMDACGSCTAKLVQTDYAYIIHSSSLLSHGSVRQWLQRAPPPRTIALIYERSGGWKKMMSSQNVK